MGSRYGGLKQLDGLGPNGETIMDYSIYDAIRAGFGKLVFVIRKDFVLPELTNPKDIYHTLNWRAIDFDKVIQYYIDFYSDEACTEKLSLQHSAACHYIVWRRHHDAEGNPTKNDKVMEDTVMLPAGVTTYNLPYTFEAKDYLTLHGYRYDYEIVGIEYR